MTDFELMPDEYDAVVSAAESIGVLGEIFNEDQGSPAALRMVIASMRATANALEPVAERWERGDA